MNKTLYFVRHGDRENMPGDPDLSSLGVTQSQLTAKHLKELSIEFVYTSPYKRCLTTAEIISKEASVPMLIDARLGERMNWDGRVSLENFKEEWEKSEADRNYQPPNGLSSNQVGTTVKNFLEALVEVETKNRIVVVTHGGVISDSLLTMFKPEELREIEPDFSSYRSSFISECSITTVNYSDKGWGVVQIASTEHLKGIQVI